MNCRAILPLAAAILFTASAGHASNVRSDYDHGANFARYHTYSWSDVKTNEPFIANRIRYEVNLDLKKKGWQVVPSGGSATIFAHSNVRDEREMETYYNGFGGGWGGGWGWGGWGWGGWGPGGFGDESTTQTVHQPVNHLVIDIFGGRTHRLLFRGVAENDLGNNSVHNTQQLFKDVDTMFKHFPPKVKSE